MLYNLDACGKRGSVAMSVSLGIIDDDKNILYTVKAMAESLGWSIRTTDKPDDVFSWVKENIIDILLVDYHMPLMSGVEVVRKCRQLSPSVTILALTVEESPDVARELLLAGADDFVSKPLRFADFTARISLHAELAKYRCDANWNERSKGLSEETARRVLNSFENNMRGLTVAEASELLGLAYPTVHRYLEYLVKKGQLQRKSEVEDGKSGRPRNIYCKNSRTIERE